LNDEKGLTVNLSTSLDINLDKINGEDFCLLKEAQLIRDPFQSAIACVRIDLGKVYLKKYLAQIQLSILLVCMNLLAILLVSQRVSLKLSFQLINKVKPSSCWILRIEY